MVAEEMLSLRLTGDGHAAHLELEASPRPAMAAQPGPAEEPWESERFGDIGLTPVACGQTPGLISLWHDVRLRSLGAPFTYSFVVENPSGELSRAGVAAGEASNPIKGDRQATEALARFGSAPPFNDGILPQTLWGSGDEAGLGLSGDSAPLGCVEISGEPLRRGSVHEVVVLGAIRAEDGGGADWKVVAVRQSTHSARLADLGPLEASSRLHQAMLPVLAWMKQWYEFEHRENSCQCVLEIMPPVAALNRIYSAHMGWLRLISEKSAILDVRAGKWLSHDRIVIALLLLFILLF